MAVDLDQMHSPLHFVATGHVTQLSTLNAWKQHSFCDVPLLISK